jgi:hypothetical protein
LSRYFFEGIEPTDKTETMLLQTIVFSLEKMKAEFKAGVKSGETRKLKKAGPELFTDSEPVPMPESEPVPDPEKIPEPLPEPLREPLREQYNVIESNIIKQKEKERESNSDPPSFPPFLNPNFSNIAEPPEKNYVQIFEEVKSKWKEVVGQETKETLFQVSPTKRERFVNALAIYSVDDIFNAIGNYKIMRNDPEEFDIGGRTYGNLIGFLENGVSQFFHDETAEANFRRRKDGG